MCPFPSLFRSLISRRAAWNCCCVAPSSSSWSAPRVRALSFRVLSPPPFRRLSTSHIFSLFGHSPPVCASAGRSSPSPSSASRRFAVPLHFQLPNSLQFCQLFSIFPFLHSHSQFFTHLNKKLETWTKQNFLIFIFSHIQCYSETDDGFDRTVPLLAGSCRLGVGTPPLTDASRPCCVYCVWDGTS